MGSISRSAAVAAAVTLAVTTVQSAPETTASSVLEIDHSVRLRAVMQALQTHDESAASIEVQGHQLTYSVIAPLERDEQSQQVVGGSLRVVDDTDADPVYVTYTFGPGQIDVSQAHGAVFQRMTWQALGLHEDSSSARFHAKARRPPPSAARTESNS